MKTNLKNLLITLISIIFLASVSIDGSGQTTPSDIIANLNSYNVTWNSASTTGSAGSMPLGNGDITSNVWVESNGDLMLYIGKSDTWSEGTRLLKVGRIRISLLPNPFLAVNTFKQELNLYKGEININAGAAGSEVNLKVWIDANNPVIHVEANSSQKFALTCKVENIRPLAYTLPSSTDPIAFSFKGVADGTEKPSESADIVASKAGIIEWYHRNTSSMFSTILTNENLGESVNSYTDPYLNRTFGGIVKADGFSKTDDYTLHTSCDTTSASISIYSYTSQTATIEDWENQINAKIIENEATPLASAYTNHCNWWDSFWNRSWIFITGNADATLVTQSYIHQRFMTACMGRGNHPIKFNGGTFTFDYRGKNVDYRDWGPGYWNQNTRHLYWPMLSAGDYEMMMPWFDCYMNMIPIQKEFTKKIYNHDGALFPETFNFFGLNILDDWGWGNTGIKTFSNQYIRYHYSGALEVISQMLDYYYFTKDPSFIEKYIVPFSTEVIRFYDKHYARENGKIKFFPANALETYWDCTNPTDIIAGLRYSIPRLCALPDLSVTQVLKDEWNNCLSALPPIPMDSVSLAVKPAEIFGKMNNGEDPDCYSIFPYKIWGLGRDSLDIAVQTFGSRQAKGSRCWAPDPIWAAMVGITDGATQAIISNANSVEKDVRFPTFWAFRDYIPDFDNGGVLMMGLQSMLLQNVDSQLLVLPAWPSTWSVDYKLQAYDNTTVMVKSQGLTISQLEVFPTSRLKDVVLPTGKQNQSIIFSELTGLTRGTADLTLNAVVSSTLPVTYTSSDTTVAKVIGTKVHAVAKGSTMITAFQSGNSSFNESARISRELIVTSKIEAEKFSGQRGTQPENCSEGGLDVTSLHDGDYTFYRTIDLTGVNCLEFRVAGNIAVGSSAGTIEIRTGSATGTLIGSVTVPGTGGPQIWTTISTSIIATQGAVNLYLVYNNNPAFSINWFDIISYPTSVENLTEKTFGFVIFPNPAGSDCQIAFTKPDDKSCLLSVKIFSIQGALIQSDNYRIQSEYNQIRINTSNLKSGIYFIDCSWDGFKRTEKLIIR